MIHTVSTARAEYFHHVQSFQTNDAFEKKEQLYLLILFELEVQTKGHFLNLSGTPLNLQQP